MIADPDYGDRYRMLMRQLPMRFHGLPAAEQAAALPAALRRLTLRPLDVQSSRR